MSPAGWLPVHRDQLRAQCSVTSMKKLYLFYINYTAVVKPQYAQLCLQKVPLPTGESRPMIPSSSRFHITNGNSISSAIFVGLTQTEHQSAASYALHSHVGYLITTTINFYLAWSLLYDTGSWNDVDWHLTNWCNEPERLDVQYRQHSPGQNTVLAQVHPSL